MYANIIVNTVIGLLVPLLRVNQVENANFVSIQSKIFMSSQSSFLEITSLYTWGVPFCSAQCVVNENCSVYAIVKEANNQNKSDQMRCILFEKTNEGNGTNELCINCKIYELSSSTEDCTTTQSTTTETMSTSTIPSTTTTDTLTTSTIPSTTTTDTLATSTVPPTGTTTLPYTTTTIKPCPISCTASAMYMRQDENGLFACTFCQDKKLYLITKKDDGWCTVFYSTPVNNFYQGLSGSTEVKAAVQIWSELTLLIDKSGVWYFFKPPPNPKPPHLVKDTDHCMPQQMKGIIVEYVLQVNVDYFLFMESNKNYECIKNIDFKCNKTGGWLGRKPGDNDNDKKGHFGGLFKGKDNIKKGGKQGGGKNDKGDDKNNEQNDNSQIESSEVHENMTLDDCISTGDILKEISSIAVDQLDGDFYEIHDNVIRLLEVD